MRGGSGSTATRPSARSNRTGNRRGGSTTMRQVRGKIKRQLWNEATLCVGEQFVGPESCGIQGLLEDNGFKSMSSGKRIATLEVSALVTFEPCKHGAVVIWFPQKRSLNGRRQRERSECFFHGNLQHGMEEAEETKQVLLCWRESAKLCRKLTETRPQDSHAQDLRGRPGVELNGDRQRGHVPKLCFTHDEAGGWNGGPPL